LFLLHYGHPAHRAVLVKDLLANNNVATLQQPPYSPNLTAADFYLFPPLKSALNGRHFFDADISKNGTEELKMISPNGFQECFQHLYSRWQKCTVAQREIYLK
jgi:hypothetical protein